MGDDRSGLGAKAQEDGLAPDANTGPALRST